MSRKIKNKIMRLKHYNPQSYSVDVWWKLSIDTEIDVDTSLSHLLSLKILR